MPIEQAHAGRFVRWLRDEAVSAARGDRVQRLPVAPDGRFWLGRLAPDDVVRASRLGERAERLDPCEVGVRVRPTRLDARAIHCQVRMVAWREIPGAEDPDADKWQKTDPIEVDVDVQMPTQMGQVGVAGRDAIADRLTAVGADGLAAEIHVELEAGRDGPELVVTIVNVSPEEKPGLDTNLYEVSLRADVGPTMPFLLEGLPDSFRYDRSVPAYGVNGGAVPVSRTEFATSDFCVFDTRRPRYWDDDAAPEPDLTFGRLARNPVEPLQQLADAVGSWSGRMWSREALRTRAKAEQWNEAMLQEASREALRAEEEVQRIRRGVALIEGDPLIRRAFMLANRGFEEAPAVTHDRWRPFQLGFVLANLVSLVPETARDERAFVDTLWFATGGGKTETYLLLTLTAAFHDRLRGKRHGITSWGRFPLRMLSLQQTQRFADVLATAELVRRRERIEGSGFALGFLVGEGGSPNRIPTDPRPGEPDPNDPEMPARYRVLIRCPFCGSRDLHMNFDRRRWALDHHCRATDCASGGRPLPFRIVDDEIYRWLPTVVLGTLDKAASVAIQAAMRGFYGAPQARCSIPDHGFTYAPRSKAKNGCLFPGCIARTVALDQEVALFGPTLRMQDELHLLRDSLGSIDAHYEALLDALQRHWHSEPKVIASSATLAGHDEQVQALYRRRGRMFPVPGPWANRSVWTSGSTRLARCYVGVASRGVTLEYANDQLNETLQNAVRRALREPDLVAREVGVPAEALPDLVSVYGVGVVYGSTLKDVEAAARSFEAQIPITPLNSVTLTGRTPLEDVRAILERLTNPEADFGERVHLIAASSMLSHGVDIDRLNVMVMLGLPLSASEFI